MDDKKTSPKISKLHIYTYLSLYCFNVFFISLYMVAIHELIFLASL